MTDELHRALEDHRAFVPEADGFAVPTARLDARVSVAGGGLFVTVSLPRLAQVVRDATPADIVADGWYEALERRLADGYDVIRGEAAADPVVTRGREAVEVTYRLRGDDPAVAVDDAKALVDFAVGTYLQGAIPGYAYDEPMRSLLNEASRRGQGGRDPEQA